mmetsp:Transcript_21816/g.63792  ORF Transcript_21816/g.63792 Transcript_21816/m.63792 type:complete len:352 (+) Transcript_21816:327-1382(+)
MPRDAMRPSCVPCSALSPSSKERVAVLVVPASTLSFFGSTENPTCTASSDRPSKLTSSGGGFFASPLALPKVSSYTALPPPPLGASSMTISSASEAAAAASPPSAAADTSSGGGARRDCAPLIAGGRTKPLESQARPVTKSCSSGADGSPASLPPAMATSTSWKKCTDAWSGAKVKLSGCAPPGGISPAVGETSNGGSGPRLAWPLFTARRANVTGKADSFTRSKERVARSATRTSPTWTARVGAAAGPNETGGASSSGTSLSTGESPLPRRLSVSRSGSPHAPSVATMSVSKDGTGATGLYLRVSSAEAPGSRAGGALSTEKGPAGHNGSSARWAGRASRDCTATTTSRV